MASLETEEKHALVEKEKAEKMGYTVTGKNYCKYPFCPWAAACKRQKCGAGSKNEQEGQARAPHFCIHPRCRCGYHALCYSYAHHLL